MDSIQIYKELAELSKILAANTATLDIIMYIFISCIGVFAGFLGFIYLFARYQIGTISKENAEFRENTDKRLQNIEQRRDEHRTEITRLEEKLKAVIRICRLRHGEDPYTSINGNNDEYNTKT